MHIRRAAWPWRIQRAQSCKQSCTPVLPDPLISPVMHGLQSHMSQSHCASCSTLPEVLTYRSCSTVHAMCRVTGFASCQCAKHGVLAEQACDRSGSTHMRRDTANFARDAPTLGRLAGTGAGDREEDDCFTSFTFSRVFGPDASQQDFYRATAAPMVRGLMDSGLSSVMMAYGVSGAGKTYTMEVRHS